MQNKEKIIHDFFKQFFDQDLSTVLKEQTPKDMIASTIGDSGWHNWKPINGTFTVVDKRLKKNIEFGNAAIAAK